MKVLVPVAVAAFFFSIASAEAQRRPPLDPNVGDKRARCRAEASYIGGGGKGGAQRVQNTLELRRACTRFRQLTPEEEQRVERWAAHLARCR